MFANRIASLVLLILVFGFSRAEADLIVFQDGDFGTHWVSNRIEIGSGGSTQSGATNKLTGGNPDAFRSSDHAFGGRTGSRTSRLVHVNTLASYDPSLGAISDISFSFDEAWFPENSTTFPTSVLFGAAAKQDGRLFHAPGGSLTEFTNWTPFEFTNLTAADFVPSEPAFADTAILDFSLNSSSIEFGFYSEASHFFTVTAMTGVDNWQASITAAGSQTVPEPSTMVLMAFGLIGVGYLRLRRVYRKA